MRILLRILYELLKGLFYLIVGLCIIGAIAIAINKHETEHNSRKKTSSYREEEQKKQKNERALEHNFSTNKSTEQKNEEYSLCEKQCLKGCEEEVKTILNDCEFQILGMEMNKTDGATIASFRNQCLQRVMNDVHPACVRSCRAECRK